MKILTLLALLLLSATANAQSVTSVNVTWTDTPTTYPDGTPMPSTDIAFVTISWVALGGGTTLNGTLQAPFSPPTITVATTCGTYIFSGAYTTTATAHVLNATSLPATAQYNTGVTCPPGVAPAAPTLQGVS
jgi:hypothetical protein